jgi:GntR family transcriptional regulator/MocR family aminotransferase
MEEPFSEGSATLRRKAEVTLPAIRLDRGSGVALVSQLAAQLRGAILRGEFANGRLPSTRALAKNLRVSRNVALEAYEILAMEELLSGRVGSGTRVRRETGIALALPGSSGLSARALLRNSHYPDPAGAIPLRDPDGNYLYLHR